jgi:hypothetical protein
MTAKSAEARATIFERGANVVAWASVIGLLFLPLYLIHAYSTTTLSVAVAHKAEATVGIGVLLRATARRLLRTGASTMWRAFSRATARTFTRRLVRTTVRPLLGLVTRGVLADDAADGANEGGVDLEPPAQPMPVALGLGFVGLAASFWGILAMISPEQLGAVTENGSVSVWFASVLAGAPLILYSVLTYFAAHRFGVEARFNTGIDGLLLQAYFTGAGSYLPMTTDVVYHGNEDKQHWVAALPLAGLFVAHLVLLGLSLAMDSFVLEFASSTFLIYVFVYSFPISPLEGYDIWKKSKLMWLAFFAPILASFALTLPVPFTEIL